MAVAVLIIYWSGMFVATHAPDVDPGHWFRYADKVAHTCAYALLAWMAAMVLRVFHWPVGRICIFVFVVCATYGAIDEWLQQYTQRRTDFYDWLADLIGVTIGLTVFLVTHRLVRAIYHQVMGQTQETEGA